METIRILEENGCTRVFNPIYVKDIGLIPPDANDIYWNVLLNFNDGGTVVRQFPSRDKAEVFFRYVDKCVKSIGK